MFDTYKPSVILGQHVLPNMKTGHVGFKSGMYMASGDEVHIWVNGRNNFV